MTSEYKLVEDPTIYHIASYVNRNPVFGIIFKVILLNDYPYSRILGYTLGLGMVGLIYREMQYPNLSGQATGSGIQYGNLGAQRI